MNTRHLDPPAEAVYRWSWGIAERARVLAVNVDTGAVYVDWPDSARVLLDGRAVERVPGSASVNVGTGELGRPRGIPEPYAAPAPGVLVGS